jgi:hypothetical protein
MRCRAMVRGSDQPQTNRFRSLLTVSHVDRDPLGLGQAHDARRSSAVACTKISLPPRSGPTKPNPFMALYHFTLPSSSTVARSVRCNQGVPAESYGAVPVRPYWRPAQNLRHLWPFCRGLGAHLKYRARRYATLSAALDHAYLSGAPRNARSARTRATKIENRCFRERLFLTPAPRLQAHDHSEVERRVFDKQVRRQCPAGRVELRAASRNGMASDRGLAM